MVLRAKFLYVLVLAVILGSVLVSPGLVNGVDTYYGDFTSSTLLEKVGTVRKWEVTNNTLYELYDENYNNASPYTTSTITRDYTTFAKGISSVHLNGTGVGILFTLNSVSNISSTNYLHYSIKKVSQSNGLAFNLVLGYGGSDYYYGSSYPNNNIWTEYVVNINGLWVTGGNILLYNDFILDVYVDDIYLSSDLPTYYEIWDGSTLKYQGLINPDIEDFSAVSVAEPILGFTFIALAFSGLAVTIFYWVSKRLVLGLLSVLVMLGTGFYWLILSTALPILAWIWILIGLVNLVDFVIRVIFIFGDQIADEYGYRWDFLRNKGDD